MQALRYRFCRAVFRQHSLLGNAAVAILAVVGVVVTGYASWYSWQSEADNFRSSYIAAADNRTSAVEHSAKELVARLEGIALGVRGGSPETLGTLVEGFIPERYKLGELVLLGADGLPRLSRCLGDCADGEDLEILRRPQVGEAVAAARVAGHPVATEPLTAPSHNGTYTSWIAFAVPVAGDQMLLAVVDGMDLVEVGLAYLRPFGIDVYVFDETAEGQTAGKELVYFHRSRRSTRPLDRDPHRPVWTGDLHSGSFSVAGRKWTVHNEPIRPIAEEVGWVPWFVLGAGLVLTLGVTVTLAGQVRVRRAVEHQVDKRTKRLHQANCELQESIQQHQRTEDALAVARDKALEASRLKSAFLANVSHEIRTPLNGIVGFAQVLLHDDEQMTAEHREYAQTIIRCATDLAALINDILDMSRIEAGKIELYPALCDLRALLAECCVSIQRQAEAKGLDFTFWVDPEAPSEITVDEGRLKQVLRNLLVNAVKFTEHGSVRLKCLQQADATHLQFVIEDTGRGLDPATASRLFQRFSQEDGSFQRPHGGLGLGLAISRELMELMGGQIGVDSELGAGSRFWITLPIADEATLRSVQQELTSV